MMRWMCPKHRAQLLVLSYTDVQRVSGRLARCIARRHAPLTTTPPFHCTYICELRGEFARRCPSASQRRTPTRTTGEGGQ